MGPEALAEEALAELFARQHAAMHLQSIQDLHTGELVGQEALVRSRQVSPLDLLAAADRAGKRDRFEALLLGSALRVPRPRGSGLLCLNVSAQVLQRPALVEVLQSHELGGVMLEVHGLQGSADDPTTVRRALEQWRERGARVAVDEDADGFLGLSAITELAPDWVKVDRSHVQGCASDPVRIATLEMFCKIARLVRATVVAVGVEDEADRDKLVELGITLGQGRLFDRGLARLGAPALPVPR